MSSEMEPNPTADVSCKIYSEDRMMLTTTTKTTSEYDSSERNGSVLPPQKSKQSSQTPEYVKRTAKLFENVKITEEVGTKNGLSRKSEVRESSYEAETMLSKRETVKISLDSLDGDLNKKPSYLGVSCSNSGYRNVINYDSKLREGFWANSQRESLVLTSSRLRDSSPLRRDFDFKSYNGSGGTTKNVCIEKEESGPVNGLPEKFVNISTSTKTISTFRNSKDMKDGEEVENYMNGTSTEPETRKPDAETKVNLKQILNGKNEETHRKGYSGLGFSPKILKSPEKNCNSFLKSINSFENHCKKSGSARSSSTYSRSEQTIRDSNNSIQQRIERLYGPGALAQGFYAQKSEAKMKVSEKAEATFHEWEAQVILPKDKPQTPAVKMTNGSNFPVASSKVLATEQCSNGQVTEEPGLKEVEGEKNGYYFLKLLKKETDRLESLASYAESELENGENLPEEISGKLRAAAGKARLLVCQKLHQFEGLCRKNLNEKPGEQFPTTSEDLAGFWDMVMLQIVQVYGVFDELDELKKNNWKALPTKKESSSSTTNGQSQSSTKTTPKKSTSHGSVAEKHSQKSEAAKKAREEGRRKLLEERRKKMKELKENKIISNENEVEIFTK